MSKCLGKSSAIFSTVFPNIIQTTNRYFQRIIKYMRSILPPAYTGQIHKSEILQKMGYFPYGNDTYTESIQKIVKLGKTNPYDAIDLLTTLNPFISSPTLYNNFIINMGLDSEESQVIQRFLQLSSMYIFADTVPQILSFINQKLSTNSLLESVLLLIKYTSSQNKSKNENNDSNNGNKESPESSTTTEIPDNAKIDNISNNDSNNIDLFDCIEPFRSIFDQHWRIIIKKCSVIIGFLSIYDFPTVYTHFTSFLQNVDQYNARNVTMFRFIRIPAQIMRTHSFTVVDTIKKNHHNHDIMKPLVSYLRFIAMQTDDSDSLGNILVAKKYAMKFPEYKQHTTEIDAIVTSKKPNLSIDYFIEFITKLFSEVQPPNMTKKQLKNDYLKPKVQLRCFLYLLRGSKFDESFFWRGGDNSINGRIDETKEKEFMWNSNAPISRIFSVFRPFFEKIDCPSEYLIKSIFENFALRNVEQTVSMISIFLLNSSESRTLVLLQALSHIAEKHHHTFNETTKTTLFTLLQKYSVSEPSTFAISPPTILESSIFAPLDSNFTPESSQFINKIVNSADESDFYMKKQLSSFEFQRCSLNYQQNFVRSRRILEKITISLISLLTTFVTTIKSGQFIQILIGLSFSSKYNIAIYSLYTIEYLYFKYDELKMTICDLIFKELIEISSDEKSLTFLSLLERLLTRKFPSQNFVMKKKQNNSNDDFFDKLEAVILLHLSSPFIEVRMVCLNLSKFLKRSLFDVEIERIQKNFPETKLPVLKFEEICSSSCLSLYSNFYSEILLKLNANDQKVIDILKSVDVTSLIRFSLNQQLAEIKPYSFQQKILLFVMVYRLQSITKNQLSLIQQDIKRLSKLNYLTCYSINNPFLSQTSDELHNTLKKSFSFLLSNLTSNGEINWPFDFLMKTISIVAFHPISVFLSILSKQLKTVVSSSANNEIMNFLSKALTLLKSVSQMPDLQLLLCSFPTCFDSMKGCFTSFENFVKKISSSSLNKEIFPLISLYAKIINNISVSITADFEAGQMGSIHVYEPFEYTKSLNWSVEERYHTFFFFEKIVSNSNTNNDNNFESLNGQILEDIESAITGLLRSGPVFRKASDFRGDLSYINSCLSSVLPFHPFLFSQFAKECFSLNSVYFQAICDQIVGKKKEKEKNEQENLRELTKREIKANINYYQKRAILLLLSSIFYELEKNFQEVCLKLTRRIACLISVLVSPEDNSKLTRIFSSKKKNLLESIFKEFPFVASEVFIEGMNQLKLGVSSPVASQILDVLCKAAIHIDLQSRSLSFISHLVELYHSISRSFDKQYCDIFINLCKFSELNQRHLELSLFPLKRTDATKLILSSLIIEYPSNFIPRVVETTRLACWFFFNVMKSELSSPYYIDCCIHLIEKLCETHFSAIEDYLTKIIHFCFLFRSNYQEEIQKLLITLSNRMKVDIFYQRIESNNDENQLNSEKSLSESEEKLILNEIDFIKAVTAFSEYFNDDKKEEWEKIALSWFVSCGDLHIAMKSGEIFCLLPLHSEETIVSICTSICSVMSFPSLKKHSIIIKYANRGFEMIRSVLEKRKVSTKMMEKLFRFLCAFIGTPDTKIICGFFTLISFFVKNPEMVEIMNLPSLYSRVVKYLNPSNDAVLHSASLFLANTIVHVSDSKIRALSFCLLLPVIYSSLRISDNLDRQTTEEILHLMTSAQLGGTLPNIISNFIQIHESSSSFIDEIIKDLYVNHLSDIELIGQYYAQMCEQFDDSSAVFDIALSLFKVSDKEWFIENFMGVVRAACKQKATKGLDLIAAITESYRGAMFTWKGILTSTNDLSFDTENSNLSENHLIDLNSNDLKNDSKLSFEKLVEDLKIVVSSMHKKKKKIPVGVVSLDEFEDFIPMIPLKRESAKNCDELLKDVRQMIPEPLSTDTDDYVKLKQLKTKQNEPEIVEPKAETFKLHADVPIVSDNDKENPTDSVPIDFFLPDDFDEFLSRIT